MAKNIPKSAYFPLVVKLIPYDPHDRKKESLVVAIPDLNIFLSLDPSEITDADSKEDLSRKLSEVILNTLTVSEQVLNKKGHDPPRPSLIRESIIKPKGSSTARPSEKKREYQRQLIEFLEKAQSLAREEKKEKKTIYIDEWVSTKRAAKILGVSRDTIARACDQNKIKSKKTPGGHRKVLLSSVLENKK